MIMIDENTAEELSKAEEILSKICDETEVRCVYFPILFGVLVDIRGILHTKVGFSETDG